jgi:NitT/TauT family transport system substrate-binding protein
MRRIAVAVAALITLLAVAGCKPDDDQSAAKAAPAENKVSLGVIPIIDVAPAYLGKQKGFFSSRGINLTLVPEQSGPAVVQGVLSGKYQFGFSNVTSLMAAQADGSPLRAVASGVASNGRQGRDFSAIVVPDGSPIRSAKDLAGKVVGVNALKSLGDTTVRQSVRKAGGDPRNIIFKAIPFPSMPGALQAHQVDAAWVVEPQLSGAIALGSQVIASNLVDTATDMTVALYFTGNETPAKDPDLAARFTAAINQSMQYADSHPDEVRAVVGTYTQISDSVRTSMILPTWPKAINRASLQRLETLGDKDGIFSKPPSLEALLPAS